MGVTDPTENNGLRPLFLFFGWYREITERGGTYSYVRRAPDTHRRAPDIHAFFGWLQVAQKINLAGRADREEIQRKMPWAASHPHVACPFCDGQPNAIYIAPELDSDDDHLILDGHDTGLPASGMFRNFDREIHTLTIEGQPRTNWRLPSWFWRAGEPTLGMNTNRLRWHPIEGHPDCVRLESVDIGQEFVFDSLDHDRDQVRAWVTKIIKAGQGRL
jgi:hypothetical protein